MVKSILLTITNLKKSYYIYNVILILELLILTNKLDDYKYRYNFLNLLNIFSELLIKFPKRDSK